MPKASILQFKNYKVSEMHFESTPVSGDQHEFELHPEFHSSIANCEGNQYDVSLSVEIASPKTAPCPFV